MCLFRRRLKLKKLYNTDTKTVNIKGIKASIPKKDLPFDIGVGEINVSTLPREMSDKLHELDLLQFEAANSINSMKEGSIKEEKKGKYFDTLIEMMKIAQNVQTHGASDSKKKPQAQVSNGHIDIYDILRTANHVISNMKSEDFQNTGLIIWPVALKNKLSIIHKAQIEVIRVLQSKGWQLKIIIADCGIGQDYDIPGFKKEILSYLSKRAISHESIELLSTFFQSEYQERGDILTKFVDISSSLKISELSSFNKKDDSYAEEIKKEIDERPVLKFIQPILTWSVVLHLASTYSQHNTNQKALIIAGRDEEKQWRHVFDQIFSNIGAIFIPILRTKANGKEYTASQENLRNFYSEDEVVGQLDNGNISRWLFDSFIQLPFYPANLKFRDLGFCNKGCKGDEDCIKCLFPSDEIESLPSFVDKNKFVKEFWPIINPA